MSDTPRTDAETRECYSCGWDNSTMTAMRRDDRDGECVDADHARALERELTAATTRLAEQDRRVAELEKERDAEREHFEKVWSRTCVHHTDEQRLEAGCPVCRKNELTQLAAAQADGAMLDWILAVVRERGTNGLQDFPWTMVDDDPDKEPGDMEEDDPERMSPVLDRAAIDAAMSTDK